MGRLRKFLLAETKVRKTNADVFLKRYVPTFLYDPTNGFIWAEYDEDKERYMIHRGNKVVAISRPYGKMITHPIMWMKATKSPNMAADDDVAHTIRGRISPDGGTIYIHDYGNRNHTKTQKQYDHAVKKTVDYVYKYMEHLLD